MLDVKQLSGEELWILYYYLLEYNHNPNQQNFVDAYHNMKKAVEDEWNRRRQIKEREGTNNETFFTPAFAIDNEVETIVGYGDCSPIKGIVTKVIVNEDAFLYEIDGGILIYEIWLRKVIKNEEIKNY